MKVFNKLKALPFLCLIGLLPSVSSKENILLCISREHSIASISAYNEVFSAFQPTKNIDFIVKNGTLFKKAFCSTASSELGLLSLLSGKHILQPNYNLSEIHFQHLSTLKKSGYKTAFFGAWDIEGKPNEFDHWEILADPQQSYNPEIKSSDATRKMEGHSTDIITDIAISWLTQQSKKKYPVFVIVYFNGTIRPWTPPIRFLEFHNDHLLPEPKTLRTSHALKAPPSRYQEMQIDDNLGLHEDLFLSNEPNTIENISGSKIKHTSKTIDALNTEQLTAWQLALRPQNEAFARSNLENGELLTWKYQRFVKNYLRCVRAIDENIGRIFNLVNQKLNAEEWIFCYSACHGNFLGENGWFGGSWIYEPSIRIPMVISGKNFEREFIFNQRVQFLDLLPTVLNLSNSDSHEGKNLRASVRDDDELKERVLYFEHNLFPQESMVAKHYGIRTENFKLVHYHQFDEWELFDLNKDPFEQSNLLNDSANDELFQGLKKLLVDKRVEMKLGKLEEPMPEEWRKIYRGPNARSKNQPSLP